MDIHLMCLILNQNGLANCVSYSQSHHGQRILKKKKKEVFSLTYTGNEIIGGKL